MEPMDRLELLDEWMRAASVSRYHTERTGACQSVADHSFRVGLLILHLCAGEEKEYDVGRLLKAALLHDLPEAATGDIPSPTKWKNPDLRRMLDVLEEDWRKEYGAHFTLTPNESAILKAADALELCFHCREQVTMGNRYMLPPWGLMQARWKEKGDLAAVGLPLHRANLLFKRLDAELEEELQK